MPSSCLKDTGQAQWNNGNTKASSCLLSIAKEAAWPSASRGWTGWPWSSPPPKNVREILPTFPLYNCVNLTSVTYSLGQCFFKCGPKITASVSFRSLLKHGCWNPTPDLLHEKLREWGPSEHFNKHSGDSYSLECAQDLAPLSAFQLLKPGQNFTVF